MSDEPIIAEYTLTSREVGRLFRVNPKTVSRWAKRGRVTCIRTPGGELRYRESEIRALLKGGMQNGDQD